MNISALSDRKKIDIVLAGSSNLHHWPLSRVNNPIQFQKSGGDHSPFQKSINALASIPGCETLFVTTSSACLGMTRAQIAELNLDRPPLLIVEPVERGNRCALIAAMIMAAAYSRNANTIALDASNPPTDLRAFRRLADQLTSSKLATEKLVLCCETLSNGEQRKEKYVALGTPLGRNHLFNVGKSQVAQPDQESVYCGLLFTSPKSGLQILSDYDRDVSEACSCAMQTTTEMNGCIWPDMNLWSALNHSEIGDLASKPNKSVLLRPVDLTANASKVKDAELQHRILDNGHLIAIANGANVSVVTTPDATLVQARNQRLTATELVDLLRAADRPELYDPSSVEHVWGQETELEQRPGFSIQRMVLNPEAKIDAHFHNHRSETWHCLAGKGVASIDGASTDIGAGTILNIPRNRIHSLSNTGTVPMYLLEVRQGNFLSKMDHIKTTIPRPGKLSLV